MSESRPPRTLEDFIEFYIEQGYADDEIADELGRLLGPPFNMGFTRAGEPVYLSSLRGRRQVEALIAAARGRPPTPPSDERTDYAREKIARVRPAVEHLRRSTKRSVSVSAVARRIEVDRGTLTKWIKRGFVTLD